MKTIYLNIAMYEDEMKINNEIKKGIRFTLDLSINSVEFDGRETIWEKSIVVPLKNVIEFLEDNWTTSDWGLELSPKTIKDILCFLNLEDLEDYINIEKVSFHICSFLEEQLNVASIKASNEYFINYLNQKLNETEFEERDEN